MKKRNFFIVILLLLMNYSIALCKGTISENNLYWTYIGLTEAEVLEIVPEATKFSEYDSGHYVLENYEIDNNMAYISSEVYIDEDNHVESVVVTITNAALKHYGLDEGISSAINKALEILGLSHDEIDLDSFNGEFFIEFYLNNGVKIRAFELIDGVFRVFAYGEANIQNAQETSLSPSHTSKATATPTSTPDESFISVENFDLSVMSFEELSELEIAVQREIYLRPEAQPLHIYPGEYNIGKDIPEGEYYVYLSIPSSGNTRDLSRYQLIDASGKNVKSDSPFISDTPEKLAFEKGSKFIVENSPITINRVYPSDEIRYEVEFPDGTTVPAGIYLVGREIPVGAYRFYPPDEDYFDFGVYYSEEDYKNNTESYSRYTLSLYRNGFGILIQLNEGNVLITPQTLIMTKAENVLNFD